MYTRWQKQNVEQAMEVRRVILLSGARQCGKTTLAKKLTGKDTVYRTLDDVAIREFAEADPHGFVKTDAKTLIIDEVQRVPNLLPAVKLIVDENTRPGQFLLTGSANIQSLPSVRESLAGRVRKIRLRTLTQGEILGVGPNFLEMVASQQFTRRAKIVCDRKALLTFALRGGFPEVIMLSPPERQKWHKDYVNAVLERDLTDIAHITRHTAMRDLIEILAAWSGKFMDISAIGAGLSIRRATIETYMNALESLYLIERVRPWTRTDYERVGKQTKIYMTDSGLVASILRWRLDQIELDSDRSGKLIETYIFNELAAQVDASNGEYELFHYRDREKREIDFLIERNDQLLIGIEIKAGSAVGSADFKHLKWFRDTIATKQPFIGIVLYSGEHVGKMGENLWAIPFSMLWT